MHHSSGYSCGHHAHHGFSGASCCHGGGCHDGGHKPRHFFSKEEVINQLEEYLKELKAEAKGVEEHIEQLKKKEEKH